MSGELKVNELQENNFKLVIENITEIMQQAQFAAINIAIAANRINKRYGKNSELGKTLDKLASEVNDATKRIQGISQAAIEGINYFDHNSFSRKEEIEPGTLKKLEQSFAIILGNSKKVVDMLKQLNTVER